MASHRARSEMSYILTSSNEPRCVMCGTTGTVAKPLWYFIKTNRPVCSDNTHFGVAQREAIIHPAPGPSSTGRVIPDSSGRTTSDHWSPMCTYISHYGFATPTDKWTCLATSDNAVYYPPAQSPTMQSLSAVLTPTQLRTHFDR